ncbi:hypothetical protein [Niabella hibiscisoli]|uniref:hypothetical protein n=1 Tax=Niabella hibiscisoli TaxID=1825928 RepID=UPI001F0F5499|nr:hypothetical protein [Niabella hibiscisoli]MCH5719924.1 hypothetical protein [Niabella hibiscisoli]
MFFAFGIFNVTTMCIKLKLLFCCLLISITGKCHVDIIWKNKIDNVTAQITIRMASEEKSKTFMLGSYAARLARRLNYRRSIFIDYRCAYTRTIPPAYFLSFGKGSYTAKGGLATDNQGKTDTARLSGNLMADNGLVVIVYASTLDFKDVLKLLEYGIRNEQSIRSSQKTLDTRYNFTYWQHSFESIATNKITEVISQSSKNVTSILSEPCFRFEQDPKEYRFVEMKANRRSFSYYYKDDRFFSILPSHSKTDTIVLQTSDIAHWYSPDLETALVFDSDTSFYYLSVKGNKSVISRRQTVLNRNARYYTPRVFGVTNDKVFISFTDWYERQVKSKNYDLVQKFTKERVLLFYPEDSQLIQDIDLALPPRK